MRAHRVPHVDRLVEISEREHDCGGHRHQTVLPDELTTGEPAPRERAHALGRAHALRPLPGRLDGEAARPKPVGGVDPAVRAEPLEPVTMLGAEYEGEKLDRLQAPGEVAEPSREIGRRTAGDRRRLVGGMHEHQRAGQAVGCVTPRSRLVCKLVRAPQVPERGRQRGHRLGLPEPEQ